MIYQKGSEAYINIKGSPVKAIITRCEGEIRFAYFEGSSSPCGMVGPELISVQTEDGKTLEVKSSNILTPSEVYRLKQKQQT